MGVPQKQTLLILGGNFAGVGAAHYILRHVIPILVNTPCEVILLSPSDQTYYKVAAPRNISKPSTELFFSIPEAFAHYSSAVFQFVQGTAISVDELAQEVQYTAGQNGLRSIHYDYLVIATGTTGRSRLWSLQSDPSLTKRSLLELHQKLQNANTVIIAGGGPVGVEVAGEISHFFSIRSCKLFSGGSRLLPRLRDVRVANDAESILAKKGVDIIHERKVVSAVETVTGKTVVTFDNGETEEVDVYIDTTGSKPNSDFLPRTWLDDRGYVLTEATSLKVQRAPAGVYCIGDVASYSNQNILDVTRAVPALGYTIWSDLRGAAGNESNGKSLKRKEFAQFQSDTQVVPIGPSGGVGIIFGFRIPSWCVWLLKSRTFAVHQAPGLASGVDYVKP
jgi:NADH dehydrogenase FAD-containing subunit